MENKNVSDYKGFLPWVNLEPNKDEDYRPDSRSGDAYLFNESLKLAAEIAIVTQRPLLLRGDPGSGKSSFASFIARNLKWQYQEFNVTGRTEAKDLLWSFDALRRLRDAQAKKEDIAPEKYITPGVLWLAFDYDEALEFIKDKEKEIEKNAERDTTRAVVLIDEIDKADPNVPNDLLEVIGVNVFKIDEIEKRIIRHSPAAVSNNLSDKYGNLLIVITSNEERDLPPAFIRRCIVHHLREPDDEKNFIERWKDIATLHFSKRITDDKKNINLIEQLARKCWELRRQNLNEFRQTPSIAEFLDAIRACFKLKITPDSDIWMQVERNILVKLDRI